MNLFFSVRSPYAFSSIASCTDFSCPLLAPRFLTMYRLERPRSGPAPPRWHRSGPAPPVGATALRPSAAASGFTLRDLINMVFYIHWQERQELPPQVENCCCFWEQRPRSVMAGSHAFLCCRNLSVPTDIHIGHSRFMLTHAYYTTVSAKARSRAFPQARRSKPARAPSCASPHGCVG